MSYRLSNNDKKILFVGAAALGTQLITKLIEDMHIPPEKIAGFVDDVAQVGTQIKFDKQVLCSTEELIKNRKFHDHVVVCSIGYGNLIKRNNLFRKIAASKIEFLTILSENVNLSNSVKIGKGCVVLPGCTIDTGVEIKDFCYLDVNVTIGEYSIIQNGCYLSNKATICGNCVIGESTFLGAASIVTNDFKLGRNNFVNAGCVVSQSTNDDTHIAEGRRLRLLPHVSK